MVHVCSACQVRSCISGVSTPCCKYKGYKGYKGERPQSRRLTASLFINAHEVMKEKRKHANEGAQTRAQKERADGTKALEFLGHTSLSVIQGHVASGAKVQYLSNAICPLRNQSGKEKEKKAMEAEEISLHQLRRQIGSEEP
eukprot:1136701-Pelagomonas_calceolata.AAC.2